jgi:hypothetical protein
MRERSFLPVIDYFSLPPGWTRNRHFNHPPANADPEQIHRRKSRASSSENCLTRS